MKIRILDPGLASVAGHHLDQDLRLALELKRRGHEVEAHGFAIAKPGLVEVLDRHGIGFRPTFRSNPYSLLATDRPEAAGYQLLEDGTLEDLAGVDDADLWIWPTVTPFQLGAAARCGRSVRQFAGVWWLPRFAYDSAAANWARAGRAIVERALPVTVGAYEPFIAEWCRSFAPDLPLPAVPCPHEGARPTRQEGTLRRIGFFGHQRKVRGIDLLPTLVRELVDRGYEVVVHDSGGALQQLPQHPRLVRLGYVEAFAQAIADCDLVVVPSRWESYQDQISGVGSEALASGVPVVLPAGCLPAVIAQRFGAGEFFGEYTVASILQAVDAAAARFPAVVERARAGAAAWHAVNGTDRLVDWIEANCPPVPRAAGAAVPGPAAAASTGEPPLPPGQVAAVLREAVASAARREFDRAEALARRVLRAEPEHFGALSLLGSLAAQTRRMPDAAEWFRRACAAQPGNASALSNHGVVLQELQRPAEALACYEAALAIRADVAEIHNNRGFVLRQLGRLPEALESLDRALALKPAYAEAHNNRATVLQELGRYDEALASYDRAVAARPAFVEAHWNRGRILESAGRLEPALASYDRALAIAPDFVDARVGRGNVLADLGRPVEAIAAYAEVLAPEAKGGGHATMPSFARLNRDRRRDYVFGAWLGARLQVCDWDDYGPRVAEVVRRVESGDRASLPRSLVLQVDSPELQLRAARMLVEDEYPEAPAPDPWPPRPEGARIRIGYFSTDFNDHATAHLAAELFERHDRSRFEVIGFHLARRPDDPTTARLAGVFDRFVDLRRRSDADAAALARSLGLDVAIDLNGHTSGSRMGIFARRAAPLQASYLGYPGTTGAAYFDYLVADEVVVPPQERRHYVERMLFLPGSYQVNDSRRPIAAAAPSRAELGLPEDGFVFCCFNISSKLNPPVFDAWMRILGRVPGSVLWLLATSPVAVANLRREAASRGVDPDRLVFAPRRPVPDHLARHRRADLFLDTFPYTAHTTASDALWAGLPLLTRTGASFASRVAASLLRAVGLPELVTTTAEDYERVAVELAQDRGRLAALRAKLEANRAGAPLFDAAVFARHLEAGLAAIHERRLAGLRPEDLRVPA